MTEKVGSTITGAVLTFIVWIGVSMLPAQRPIPLHQADELQLKSNDFADTYNVWARQMQSGLLDLDQMKKVERKFKRLTKAKGWPRGD